MRTEYYRCPTSKDKMALQTIILTNVGEGQGERRGSISTVTGNASFGFLNDVLEETVHALVRDGWQVCEWQDEHLNPRPPAPQQEVVTDHLVMKHYRDFTEAVCGSGHVFKSLPFNTANTDLSSAPDSRLTPGYRGPGALYDLTRLVSALQLQATTTSWNVCWISGGGNHRKRSKFCSTREARHSISDSTYDLFSISRCRD
ncbi:hypothetical protein RRG08_044646 [Elysia crispata]|uniref:Uncharacterized protein n=1 Tax=Elysia crispata TaxID=231223 RepID=A0AAE1B608_9GAST|nr:hypothetical protein RRG08_044646 [Elysia crispata]